jgi:hypothetical protein
MLNRFKVKNIQPTEAQKTANSKIRQSSLGVDETAEAGTQELEAFLDEED